MFAYETHRHYAIVNAKGHYEVYRNHFVAARRVAYIGFHGERGLRMAIEEIRRREECEGKQEGILP